MFVCLYVCVSACLWLNNSKTAEPIGLKLIACLLLGLGMVLGEKIRLPVRWKTKKLVLVLSRSPINCENQTRKYFFQNYREYLGGWEGHSSFQPPIASGKVRQFTYIISFRLIIFITKGIDIIYTVKIFLNLKPRFQYTLVIVEIRNIILILCNFL